MRDLDGISARFDCVTDGEPVGIAPASKSGPRGLENVNILIACWPPQVVNRPLKGVGNANEDHSARQQWSMGLC
jgi:hypothetical protein